MNTKLIIVEGIPGSGKSATAGFIAEHLQSQGERLHPILVYLNPLDVNETINKVSKERSSEWLDFVVWYHTHQGYGRTRGLNGMDGYVEVLATRRSLELDILANLPTNVLQIDNPQSDWAASHRKIKEHIQAVLPTAHRAKPAGCASRASR